jgi:Kef-type K+ transport system membrane component KefB
VNDGLQFEADHRGRGPVAVVNTDVVLRALHVVAALAVIVLVGLAGRQVARWLRQPQVIGEITGGILAGPAAVALLGTARFHELLPAPVMSVLKTLGELGLILLLVGVAHELKTGPARLPRRAVAWVAAGSFVPALLLGAVLALFVLRFTGPAVRGDAPAPAFVVMVAVTMAITAVPVLARILTDRGMTGTRAGRLSMSGSIAMDTAGWLLLAVAIGLRSGQVTGFLKAVAVLAGGVVVALGIRRVLRTEAAGRLCSRLPRTTAVILAAVAIAVALTVEHLGLTSILGAALVGLAVPVGDSAPWAKAVDMVTSVGHFLVPVFFVVTGVNVLVGAFSAAPWELIAVVVVLGVVGKIGGGYLGARLGGQSRTVSAQVGVMMNTRGLTELIVLQAGYSAGILTAPLMLTSIVMALVTTALTGPLLLCIDRRTATELEAVPVAAAEVGTA